MSIQNLPMDARLKIFKQMDEKTLFRVGNTYSRFIPEILKDKRHRLWLLFEAIECNKPIWVDKYITMGYDVNVEGEEVFPLRTAVSRNRPTIVQMLIEAGANVNATFHHEHKTTLLWEVSNLQRFKAHDVTTMAKILIKAGININAVNKCGSSALHYAAENGSSDLVDLLIKTGANPYLRDVWGRTPLHAATGIQYDTVLAFIQNKVRR
jgi:hypothetical protein